MNFLSKVDPMSTNLDELKAKLLANPKVRNAYDDLSPEYAVARAIIKARVARGMTQAELAKRMHTSQSFIARLESGNTLPSMKTLLRVAEATGSRPYIDLCLD
jgi:ribosome-binding protein aMBF1 (putative translation factor)